jgi:polar amino acid transport system substrate-binding protein
VRFDLWVEGSVVVPAILKDVGYSFEDVEPVMVLDTLELYLAFSAKTPASTVKIWEDALRAIKKDGSFAKSTVNGCRMRCHPCKSFIPRRQLN